MSNIKYNVNLEKTGLTYNKYNSDIKLKSTYGDFTLPAWTIENFDSNVIWKSRYNLSANEGHDNLTVQKKEELRKEVFNSWAETIWSIIRQRIGLVVDIIGWDKLDKEQQENIRLAISQQINNWRINLPYEINNNVSRVSGNLQTTINASAFTIGFDILSEQTKQSITATGLDSYDYSDLLNQCYREDSLLVEVFTNKERISLLEANKVENTLPENLLTRGEAANLYERTGQGYLTKAEAETTYLKNANIQGLENGGYFTEQSVVSDITINKRLKNSAGNKEIQFSYNPENLSIVLLNNNTEKIRYSFTDTGLLIDNKTIPNILTIDNKVGILRTEIEGKNYLTNTHLTEYRTITEIEELLNDYNKKTDTYSKTEADNLFFEKTYITANYYDKAAVDQKITTAQTSGQVDLSNYYNINEIDTLLSTNHYTKTESNNLYYTKANSDLRLSTISANIVSKTSTSVQEMTANLAAPTVILREKPVKNSNNAARMQDVISEVKRLFTSAITEYDKTAKKEFSNIGFVKSFYELESDDEEIIISVSNQQVMIDAANISNTNLLVYKNTYYTEGSSRNITQTDQLIYLKNVAGGLQFSSQSSSRNIGPAGTGNSGGQITNISTVIIRKDSVRELIKSLQNVV